jgi:hypothetical protein
MGQWPIHRSYGWTILGRYLLIHSPASRHALQRQAEHRLCHLESRCSVLRSIIKIQDEKYIPEGILR